ncbi:hypothetical protein [Streptomyces sp. NPDC004296]|uniref:hypothetical protein n=1 Tax=Streptomyces sp. NPDC004296 TaxID=3364697 RepID=UPI003682E4CB
MKHRAFPIASTATSAALAPGIDDTPVRGRLALADVDGCTYGPRVAQALHTTVSTLYSAPG